MLKFKLIVQHLIITNVCINFYVFCTRMKHWLLSKALSTLIVGHMCSINRQVDFCKDGLDLLQLYYCISHYSILKFINTKEWATTFYFAIYQEMRLPPINIQAILIEHLLTQNEDQFASQFLKQKLCAMNTYMYCNK